jgi:hypothetical protein
MHSHNQQTPLRHRTRAPSVSPLSVDLLLSTWPEHRPPESSDTGIPRTARHCAVNAAATDAQRRVSAAIVRSPRSPCALICGRTHARAVRAGCAAWHRAHGSASGGMRLDRQGHAALSAPSRDAAAGCAWKRRYMRYVVCNLRPWVRAQAAALPCGTSRSRDAAGR